MTKKVTYNLETWPVDKIIEYARNPRKNDHAVDKAAAAIKEFGFRVPLIVKSDGVLIDGHLRLKAAKKIGLEQVPVMLADDMTEAQIKAFRLSVNKIADLADWDVELLKYEFEDLKDIAFDVSTIGFDVAEITGLFLERENGETDADAEWEGMPEYSQKDKNSFRHIIVHFNSNSDVEQFAKVIGQNLTEKTKSIWFPPQERMDTESKRYDNE